MPDRVARWIEAIILNVVAGLVLAFGVGAALAVWTFYSQESGILAAAFFAGSAGTAALWVSARRPIARRVAGSGRGIRTRPTVEVMSEGVLWKVAGYYHLGTDPIGDAYCAKHRVPYLYRTETLPDMIVELGGLNEQIVRDGRGGLYCPHEPTHLDHFTESVTFQTARRRAEALLKSKLQERS